MGGGGGAPAPIVYGQEPIQINPFADFYLPRIPESPKGAGTTRPLPDVPNLPWGREDLLYGRPAAARVQRRTNPETLAGPVQPWMAGTMPMPVSDAPRVWRREA